MYVVYLVYNEGLPRHRRRNSVYKNRASAIYTVWEETQRHFLTHSWGPPLIILSFRTLVWNVMALTEDTHSNILNDRMGGNQKLPTLNSPHPKHPKHLIFHKHIHAASTNRLPTFSHLISSTVFTPQSWHKLHPSRISIIESYHVNNSRDLSHFISFQWC